MKLKQFIPKINKRVPLIKVGKAHLFLNAPAVDFLKGVEDVEMFQDEQGYIYILPVKTPTANSYHFSYTNKQRNVSVCCVNMLRATKLQEGTRFICKRVVIEDTPLVKLVKPKSKLVKE